MKQELASKTRRSILRGHKSGQAVVEYILIVAIAVGMIVIMKGAFSGMNNFINNYLGLYTECLMAHGELPALGVKNDDLKEHLNSGYKCESGFKPFTIVGGRPPVDGGSSSGSQASRNASGKSGSKAENNTANGSASSNSSSKDSKGGKDKDPVARDGSGNGSSPYEDGGIKRSGRRTADGFASAGSDKSRLIEDDSEGDELGGSGRKRRPRESRIIYRDRPRYRAILGQEAEQLTNQSSRSSIKRKPTTTSIAKADEGSFHGPRSGLMKAPPDRVIAAEEVKEPGWGFGQMLKWLLIIGILVALVIFFGGQLMNYSNSDS
ncbi:hypothetical protein CIK05_15630 [Bdellovibrio sp. qaytius]|nr:hypothetical protein CIK05_15630 [Bdellovibrio sp. qaytius]